MKLISSNVMSKCPVIILVGLQFAGCRASYVKLLTLCFDKSVIHTRSLPIFGVAVKIRDYFNQVFT